MALLLLVGVLALPALAVVALDRRGRRQKAVAWSEHPVSDSGTAFRGHKVAQLVVDERRGTAWLSGVTGRAFGVDDVAQCVRRGCRPPSTDCDCGFYAWRDRSQALGLLDRLSRRRPDRGYVLLTVDLDGDVLEYEHGFRAARQRVHRIEVPRTCSMCVSAGAAGDADGLVVDPGQRVEQALVERTAPVGTTQPRGSAVVRAVCADHRPGGRSRSTDLDTLRGLVGTEVATGGADPR